MAKRLRSALRALIVERARGCCEYCRCPVSHSVQSFSIERIIPEVRGGESTTDNLAFSCQGCNNHKYDKVQAHDPVSGLLAPLYNPRTDIWSAHFVWSPDFTIILGITPTGRATVKALHLNREGVINLRNALRNLGKHPPNEQS